MHSFKPNKHFTNWSWHSKICLGLFDSGVKCFVGGAICRKAKGGERHPIAGVPLVSVLSPLVFLTTGGLSGLSTPNSCWLLAAGPHWLCAWPNGASTIFKYRSSMMAWGDIITLSFIVSMCVYMKNCVLCFDKRMEQMLMHSLSVFKTTECVFLFHHKGTSAYFIEQSAYRTGRTHFM